VSKRSKLSRSDREKRSSKRLRRIETAGEREMERMKRRLPSPQKQFEIGRHLYEWATTYPVISSVVCETCNLAQPYRTDENNTDEVTFPESETGVTLCLSDGLLGIPCDGEYCITVEAFSGS
jgi:hypothetical protein